MSLGNLVGQGNTAEVYEWGEDKVVKLYYKRYNLEGITDEYNTAQLLCKKDLPIPDVHGLVKLKERIGLIYDRILGKTLMEMIIIDKLKLEYYARMMANLHNCIQIRLDDGLDSYLEKINQNIEYANALSDSHKLIVKEYMKTLDNGNRVCHGDFHPYNILFDGKDGIVIDWMGTTVGNPLADVANTCLILKYSVIPKELTGANGGITNEDRMRILNYYLDEYTKLTGASIEEIESWELPIAVARTTNALTMTEQKHLLNLIDTRIKQL